MQNHRPSFTLRLNYLLLRSIGMVSFKLSDLGKNGGIYGDRWTLLITAAHLVYAIFFTVGLSGYFMGHFAVTPLTNIMVSIETAVLLTVMWGSIVWCNVYRGRIYRTFAAIYRLEEELAKRRITIDHRRGNIFAILTLGLESSLWLVNMSFALDMLSIGPTDVLGVLLMAVMLLPMYCLECILTCQFVTQHYGSKQMFAGLNAHLRTVIGAKNSRDLWTVFKLHDDICDVVRSGNVLYTIQVLVVFGMAFFSLTVQFYGQLTDDLLYKSMKTGALWVAPSILVFKMGIIIFVAEQLRFEMRQTERVIIGIMVKDHNFRCKFRNEILTFFLQIMHSKVKITAGGLFEIDYALVLNLVTSIITHVMILIETDSNSLRNVKKRYFNI